MSVALSLLYRSFRANLIGASAAPNTIQHAAGFDLITNPRTLRAAKAYVNVIALLYSESGGVVAPLKLITFACSRDRERRVVRDSVRVFSRDFVVARESRSFDAGR